MYNHKPKSNVPLRKKHKSPDRKGGGRGGSTLTVSLTVKYPGFFDDFPCSILEYSCEPYDPGLDNISKISKDYNSKYGAAVNL